MLNNQTLILIACTILSISFFDFKFSLHRKTPVMKKNLPGIAQSRRPLQKTVSMDLYNLTHRNSKNEDLDQIDRIGVKWDIHNDSGNTSFLWRCDPMEATF